MTRSSVIIHLVSHLKASEAVQGTGEVHQEPPSSDSESDSSATNDDDSDFRPSSSNSNPESNNKNARSKTKTTTKKCSRCKQTFPFSTQSARKAYHDHLRTHRRSASRKKTTTGTDESTVSRAASNKGQTCDKCGFKARNRDGLVEHFGEEHAGVAPFPCEKCTERFATYDLLCYHKSTQHSRLVCDCCGKKFSSTGALHMHKGWSPSPFFVTELVSSSNC